MLTLDETRKLLNDTTLPDEQVAEIRDNMRALAEIIFEQWQQDKKAKLSRQTKKLKIYDEKTNGQS